MLIRHRMADVPFTVIQLKASVRTHNKTNTVRLTQRKAHLIAGMRKKKAAFPRDPSKQSKSKSVAAPKKKTKKRRIAPMQVASRVVGGGGMQSGLTDGQKTAARGYRKIGARMLTQTKQFRKDRNLARRIRGDI